MTVTFLDAALVDEISKESSGLGRYINPSKLDGEIRLRFFGAGITGFEGWTEDNKPVRFETRPETLPANLKQRDNGPAIKRFLAGVVWDYANEEFKILQMTQRTLMEQLFKFVKDEDYGDPTGYDIKISKTGEGMKTEYSLVAAPPKAVSKELQAKYDALQCNLKALFDGDDPFAAAVA